MQIIQSIYWISRSSCSPEPKCPIIVITYFMWNWTHSLFEQKSQNVSPKSNASAMSCIVFSTKWHTAPKSLLNISVVSTSCSPILMASPSNLLSHVIIFVSIVPLPKHSTMLFSCTCYVAHLNASATNSELSCSSLDTIYLMLNDLEYPRNSVGNTSIIPAATWACAKSCT